MEYIEQSSILFRHLAGSVPRDSFSGPCYLLPMKQLGLSSVCEYFKKGLVKIKRMVLYVGVL